MLRAVRKTARGALSSLGLKQRRSDLSRYAEATDEEQQLVALYARYSMTSPLRMWTLLKAVKYADQIEGDIVECGVWRGGNMMLAKAVSNKRVWLYDTFAGMSEPTEHDVGRDGRIASEIHTTRQRHDHNAWCYAPIEEVRANFARHGLLDDDVIFREGMVEDTLNNEALPQRISVLRLDTDWYESSLIELQILYPRLSVGGVLIIDDYGKWLGQKRAVDEYFEGRPPYLFPVDKGCRMAIKISQSASAVG